MNFSERMTQDRRLMILRLLAESDDHAATEPLLWNALSRARATLDQIRGDIAWLREQELVRTDEIAGIQVAIATQRGLDVAAGRASVPGVRRPFLED